MARSPSVWTFNFGDADAEGYFGISFMDGMIRLRAFSSEGEDWEFHYVKGVFSKKKRPSVGKLKDIGVEYADCLPITEEFIDTPRLHRTTYL